jgi:hypothetical protein
MNTGVYIRISKSLGALILADIRTLIGTISEQDLQSAHVKGTVSKEPKTVEGANLATYLFSCHKHLSTCI